MTVSLSDSANFWASVATLWAAAGAWVTYYAAVRTSRDERYAAIRALLSGLNTELDVVGDWAGTKQGGRGYEQGPVTEREHPDWCNPSRLIFSFECPIIHNLTNSPYIRELGPITADVVRLSRSITRLFNYYTEYRGYVNSRRDLYDAVVGKGARDINGRRMHEPVFTADEKQFISQVFQFNAQIHQSLIGGIGSPDRLCLYKTCQAAHGSLDGLLRNLNQPPFPRW
jgi:hypothetical protein